MAINDGSLTFSQAVYDTAEGSPFVQVTVFYAGTSNIFSPGLKRFTIVDTSGTALGGFDYTRINETRFFGDQDADFGVDLNGDGDTLDPNVTFGLEANIPRYGLTTPQTFLFNIPITDDFASEASESFSLNFTDVAFANIDVGQTAAIVRIADNDGGDPTKVFGTVGFGTTTVINVSESQGSVTIPYFFSGATAPGAPISVTYSTIGGSGTSVNNNSAVDGQDYIGVSAGTQVFPATTAPISFPITIPIINDTDVELSESFSISIDSVNGAFSGGSQRVVINIIDDDGVGGQPIVDPNANPQIFFPLIPLGSPNNDILFGTGGDDVINSFQGNDQITGFGGNDILFGGQGEDTIFGNQGNDTLYGNKGQDQVFGGQGDDTLYGGQGDDLLQGNEGNDFLSGDLGFDTLVGGAGADRFRIRTDAGGGYDYVADFQVGTDLLVLVNGLQFSDLNIAQGSEGDLPGGTVISLRSTGEILEILGNIQVGSINSSSFVSG